MRTKLMILSSILIFSVCSYANGVMINWVYYLLDDSTMTATVTYPGEAPDYYDNSQSLCYYNKITIPDTIKSPRSMGSKKYCVTGIGDHAFYCATSRSIKLPQTIKIIGDYAFAGNHYIDTIVIPNNVTDLGEYAFWGCRSLKAITLPENLKEIKSLTFSSCYKLETLTLPETITKIGGGAFSNDTSLKFINLPNGIDTLMQWAFEDCTALKSIHLPDSLKYIGKYVFENCINLDSIMIPQGVKEIAVGAFKYCKKIKHLIIPESVQSIGIILNYGCDSLKRIQFNAIDCALDEKFASKDLFSPFYDNHNGAILSIGENVIKIPDYLGYSFINQEITLPATLQFVGKEAFRYSTITNDTFPSLIKEIKYRAFLGCKFPNGIIIPHEFEFGIGAFLGAYTNRIILPSNIQTIPDSAFLQVKNFDNHMIDMIEVPNSVKTIGKCALSGKVIVLGDNVVSIGERAIPVLSGKYEWNNITKESIPIPNDISIVSFSSEPPSWLPSDQESDEKVVYKIRNHVKCYVPHGSMTNYLYRYNDMWRWLNLCETQAGGTITYSTDNTITLHFPLDDNANEYIIKINKMGYTIHEYTFDSIGNLMAQPNENINYAPKHLQEPQTIDVSFQYLEPDNEYMYSYMALDKDKNLVQFYSDKFIPSNPYTNIVNSNYLGNPSKIIENGNIHILMPNGTKYSIIGNQIR